MSEPFDAVRSAQEQNVVLDIAQVGFHHFSKSGVGAHVDAVIEGGRTLWSRPGLTSLEVSLDKVI